MINSTIFKIKCLPSSSSKWSTKFWNIYSSHKSSVAQFSVIILIMENVAVYNYQLIAKTICSFMLSIIRTLKIDSMEN